VSEHSATPGAGGGRPDDTLSGSIPNQPAPGTDQPTGPDATATNGRGTDGLGLADTGEQPVVGAGQAEPAEQPRYDDAVDDVPPADTVAPVPVPPPLQRATGSALPVRIALILAGVLLVGGLGWYFGRDDGDPATAGANVGDCLAESVVESPPTDPTQVSTVACDSPAATYRIVGLIEDRDRSDSSADEACAGFPMTTGLWVGQDKGSVYCLETVAK
jgi:hypothetical protein